MTNWIKEHIEYPIGFLSAVGSSIGLKEIFELSITGFISVGVGCVMIAATHLVKRYMHRKYPIK